MASIDAPKSSCKHSCDTSLSGSASNISLVESDISVPPNDISINGNSYVNTPSPSSIASTSTIEHLIKNRILSLRTDQQLSSKRRYRYDKLFHQTHSLNRQYVITMTNILFQMQKEIYKLRRRTQRVEQILTKQTQAGRPIIRIPRLTKDELSTICIIENEDQQNISSIALEENENNNAIKSTLINNIKPLSKLNETRSSITIQAQRQSKDPINKHRQRSGDKNKYCSACDHEYNKRSAYLQHIKKKHKGIFPLEADMTSQSEVEDISPNETIILTSDQPTTCSDAENGIEDESLQVLVNQWDTGEGRLRPRPVPKLTIDPLTKVKCDICGKFFRAEYIKKHRRRIHRIKKSSRSTESIDTIFQTPPTTDVPGDQMPTTDIPSDQMPITIDNQSTPVNSEPLSTVTTTEMDIDDMPIRFRQESNKAIVIAVTCLKQYQLGIIEEFLKKFSARACQTASIDSRTTHLITNDDHQALRSPLSMKLIEAIANHCFCVSYRWIIDCLRYDRIIDESPFEIESDDTDLHPHGGPQRSRLIEPHHSLFHDICFMIKCTENNDNKMTNDRLKDLVLTCGGQIINCVTQDLLDKFKIVVLCDKLYVSERRHNYDQCHKLGIHFVSSDWVLESILEYRQKLLSLYKEIPT